MRTIEQINADIDALHDKLTTLYPALRRVPRINYGPGFMAACERWATAWSKHPDLHHDQHALYVERDAVRFPHARSSGIFGDGVGGETAAEANAHLIAEAPVMLAALEDLVAVNALMLPNETLSGWAQRVQTAVDEARAVIARARGGV